MNLLILGMPNVGKTSLFNILSNNSKNIIHDTSGTTRDWHVASLKHNPNINIYDTPGIIINKNNQTDINLEKIINQINIILYVIDYKSINFTNENYLINNIRKFNKDLVLIINKDDNFKNDKNLENLGIKNFFLYFLCS